MKAKTIEEFFADPDINVSDLRDLCLRVARPGLQEIRDACADLYREDVEEDDDDIEVVPKDRPRLEFKSRMPRVWRSEQEKKIHARRKEAEPEDHGALIDFGVIDDDGKYSAKKMRIKICGRSIHNYSSEKQLPRKGWLQFSIIAKNSGVYEAVELCRHWDEFFELNVLARYQYFPGPNWALWFKDPAHNHMLESGLIIFHEKRYAEKLTHNHQTGGRSRGMLRTHDIVECRAHICAHIKRNDPVSRRFIQYLTMLTSELLVLVRDGKTGKIITTPPTDQLWVMRGKSGIGRAKKNDWHIISEVGPEFFETIEKARKWHFGFDEYYDVYAWDLEPGRHHAGLYQELSIVSHTRKLRTTSARYHLIPLSI